MRYCKTIDNADNDIELVFYYEVNENDLEERKIELANGKLLGFADNKTEFNGTVLHKTALVSIEEINKIPKMRGYKISSSEFEAIWQTAVLSADSSKI